MTGIDFDHLRRYTGDDDELVGEVLALFTHQTEIWGKALVASVDDDMWTSVTHALRGSANTVGATALGALCERAEIMVGEENVPGRRDYIIGEIESAIEDLRTDIQRWEYKRSLDKLRSA